MRLGIGLGISTIRGGAFSPLSLFGAGSDGFFNLVSPSNCWQDAAGTIAAGVGDLVRRLDDLSGNARHITAPSDAASPILRQTAGGVYYLEPDGVDDYMHTSGGDFSTFSHVGAWESANAFGGVWGTSNDTASAFIENVSSTIRAEDSVLGTIEITGATNGIGPYTLSVTRSTTTQARLNGVAGTTISNPNTAGVQDGIALFSRRTDTGSATWTGKYFGGIWIDPVLTADEIAATEAFFSALIA